MNWNKEHWQRGIGLWLFTTLLLTSSGSMATPRDSVYVGIIPDTTGSNMERRVQWLGLRRMTESGQIPQRVLRRALTRKQLLYSSSPFVNTAPNLAGCTWTAIGPRNVNGRIRCLAVDPTNGAILYAGAAAGGVWKSEDSGQTWRPTMLSERSLAIGALAIDPTDPQTIYAGTGEAVYREPVEDLPGTSAWVYEGEGIFKSTDGGDTWVGMPIPNDYVYRIAIDPTDHMRVLCAGYSVDGEGGLCLLDQNGDWTTIREGIFTDVDFASDGIYAAQYDQGIWKFVGSDRTDLSVWRDCGGPPPGNPNHWECVNNGLPASFPMHRISMCVASSDQTTLYAIVQVKLGDSFPYKGKLYRSQDGGASWQATGDPLIIGKGLWASMVAVDPNDADVVFAAGVGIKRSVGGGGNAGDFGSWVSTETDHNDYHDLVFVDSDEFYVANDGGVFRGTVNGTSVEWAKVSTGLVVTQFYGVNTATIAPNNPQSCMYFGGGTQDNGTLIGTGGLSWWHVLGSDGGNLVFNPNDPHEMWGQAYGNGGFGPNGVLIMHTVDGWETSSLIPKVGGGVNAFAEVVFPAAPLVRHSESGTLFVGSNQILGYTGADWTGRSPEVYAETIPDVFSAIAISTKNPDVIYAGTLYGRFFRAEDGGVGSSSFVEFTPPPEVPRRWISSIAVHPDDENTFYVSFLQMKENSETDPESDHVWKAQLKDSGDWEWQKRSSGLLDVPTGAILIADDLTLYAGTDVGVYRSLDDGVTWEPFELGLPTVPISDLAFSLDQKKLVAATHGRGTYEIHLDGCCCPVDLYVRDNILDTGEVEPSPSGISNPLDPNDIVHFWESADIKVDAPAYDETDPVLDGVEFDNVEHKLSIETIQGLHHDNPARGQTNKVRIQVHNRGPLPANAVTVKAIFAQATAGTPALPDDFWEHFFDNGFDQTYWEPIGEPQTIPTLEPQTPKIVEWDWDVPEDGPAHGCILAMVHSSQDPLLPQTQTNAALLAWQDKHVTQKNVHLVTPSASKVALLIAFHNVKKKASVFDFEIEQISPECTEVWLVLPDVRLANPLDDSLRGFSSVGRREMSAFLESTKEMRQLGKRERNLLASRSKKIFLVKRGEVAASISGVVLDPMGSVEGLVIARIDPGAKQGTHLFDVMQSEQGQVIGGSDVILSRHER